MPYIPDHDPKIPSELAAEVRAFEEPYHEYWYRRKPAVQAPKQQDARRNVTECDPRHSAFRSNVP